MCICPAEGLNGNASHIEEGIVAYRDVAVRIVEYGGMGADAARTIAEGAVFDQNIFAAQILGAVIVEVAVLDNIELQGFICLRKAFVRKLVGKGAAGYGESVHGGGFYKVIVVAVAEADIFHHHVFGMTDFEHGTLKPRRVKDAALNRDIAVMIAGDAVGEAVHLADAQHVSRLR